MKGRSKSKSFYIKKIHRILKLPRLTIYSKTWSKLKKKPWDYLKNYMINLYKWYEMKSAESNKFEMEKLLEDTESSVALLMKTLDNEEFKKRKAITDKLEMESTQVEPTETTKSEKSAPIKKRKSERKSESSERKSEKDGRTTSKSTSKKKTATSFKPSKLTTASDKDRSKTEERTDSKKQASDKKKVKFRRKFKYSIPPKVQVYEYPLELPSKSSIQLQDEKENRTRPYESYQQAFGNKITGRRYFNVCGTLKLRNVVRLLFYN